MINDFCTVHIWYSSQNWHKYKSVKTIMFRRSNRLIAESSETCERQIHDIIKQIGKLITGDSGSGGCAGGRCGGNGGGK